MTRIILCTLSKFLLLFLFIHHNGNANNPENALLWKISGNGLESPSYLYGTIHVICPDDVHLTDRLKSCFSETGQLVTEIDMSDPQMMQKMMTLMLNPNMANVQDKLSEEEKKLVNDFLKQHYNNDLTQMGMFKPFALISMVVVRFLSCPQPASYESIFTEMATTNVMAVYGLETIEYQMSLLDEMSGEMLKELVRTIKEFDDQKIVFDNMIKAYKDQDLLNLKKIMEESEYQLSSMDVLLDRRNKEWIPKIEEYIQEKPTFIAVGAGHLWSDNGVVNLLRQKGYHVEPLKF